MIVPARTRYFQLLRYLRTVIYSPKIIPNELGKVRADYRKAKNMTTYEQLTQALDRIYNGGEYSHENFGDIFSNLPEVASGSQWVGEVNDAVQSIREYLTEGEEYELDGLSDYANEYASSCCETYYKTIHDLVHSLSLWASNDIEQDLEDMGATANTLVEWESLYLYSAMAITWRATLEQAFIFAEELEEVSA